MSNKLVLEIRNFYGNRDLHLEIIGFNFPQIPAVSASAMGSSSNTKFKDLNHISVERIYDKSTTLLTNKIGAKFPEMKIKGVYSRGTDGFLQRGVFTFSQPILDSFSFRQSSSDENLFSYDISFAEFSAKIDSTADVLKKVGIY